MPVSDKGTVPLADPGCPEKMGDPLKWAAPQGQKFLKRYCCRKDNPKAQDKKC